MNNNDNGFNNSFSDPFAPNANGNQNSFGGNPQTSKNPFDTVGTQSANVNPFDVVSSQPTMTNGGQQVVNNVVESTEASIPSMVENNAINIDSNTIVENAVSQEQTTVEPVVEAVAVDNTFGVPSNPIVENTVSSNINEMNSGFGQPDAFGTTNAFGNTNDVTTAYQPYGSSEPVKSNKKVKIIGIIVGIVALLAVIAFAVYKMVFNSPLALFKVAVSDVFADAREIIKDVDSEFMDIDFSKDAIVNSGSLKLNVPGTPLEDYKDQVYNYEFGFDLKNEQITLGASINDSSKELISVLSSVIGEKGYADFGSAFDKVISMNLDGINFDEILSTLEESAGTITIDDIDYILTKFPEYLNNSLSKDDFTKESAEIEVNGENIKVVKNVLFINEDNANRISKSIIESIKNDDRFVSILAISSGSDKDEIISNLGELYNEDIEFTDEVYIEFYTEGLFNNSLGFGVIVNGVEEVRYTSKDDEVNVVFEDSIYFNAKTVDDVTKFSVKMTDIEYVTGTYTEKDNDSFSLVVKYSDGMMNDVKVNVDFKTVNSTKDLYEIELDVDVDASLSGQVLEVNANLENKVEKVSKLDIVSTSGAVDVEELTDEDFNELMSNISTNGEGTILELFFDSWGLIEENVETNTKCATAGFCTMNEDNTSMTCKYKDEYGIEEEIICPNTDMGLDDDMTDDFDDLYDEYEASMPSLEAYTPDLDI